MRRNHLEHHGEHDGQDKPRADALHRTAGERYRKRGGNRTRNRADEEGAEHIRQSAKKRYLRTPENA